MVKRLLRVAIIVELILLVGFLPTLFNPQARLYGGPGGGWDWSPWGLIGPLAGLMFVAGVLIDLAVRKVKHPVYRTFVIAMLVLAVGLVWARIVWSE